MKLLFRIKLKAAIKSFFFTIVHNNDRKMQDSYLNFINFVYATKVNKILKRERNTLGNNAEVYETAAIGNSL